MQGSLQYPVQLTILEGKKTIFKTTLIGIHLDAKTGAPNRRAHVLLPDDNAEYTLEWAQCENERAPRPASAQHEAKEAAQYECGNAAAYKTETLVTKRHDAPSRKIAFAAPPKPQCWGAR